MDRIIQEKISADHLLYVSLKYTKTADVILNLLSRWRNMIELSIDKLLEKSKKDKKIKLIPDAPKVKVDVLRQVYKKDQDIIKTLDLYEFFKKIPDLEKLKENEFRKNVTLKVQFQGNWLDINMDKLKEYAISIENFIGRLKKIV